MHPKERMQEDLKAAMKSGDVARRDALRLLSSLLRQVEVDQRKTLTEEDVYGLLAGEAKRRRESIDEAQKAGREDVAATEQDVLKIIMDYLPSQLTREELEAEARKAIEETGAKTAKDMNSVMKVLMPRVKNRADGKLINDVVKALLTS